MQSLQDRLIEAVKANKLEAFRNILKTQSFDLDGLSCLHYATLYQRLEMIDELIRAGADINHPGLYDGQFPLYVASSMNHMEVIKKLLNYGANPDLGRAEVNRNARNASADTAEVVKILTTPLLRAIESNYINTVKLLVEAGADVNQCDQDGYAPLVLATEKGQDEVVTYLLLHGADIEVVSPTGRNLFEVTTREDLHKILKGHLTRSAAKAENASKVKKPSLWKRWFGGSSSASAEFVEEKKADTVSGAKMVTPVKVVEEAASAGAVLKPSASDSAGSTASSSNVSDVSKGGAGAGKQHGRYVMPAAPRITAGTIAVPPLAVAEPPPAPPRAPISPTAVRKRSVSSEISSAPTMRASASLPVSAGSAFSTRPSASATALPPISITSATQAAAAVASADSALPMADAALAEPACDSATLLGATADCEPAGTRQLLVSLCKRIEALEKDQQLLKQLQSTVQEQAQALDQQRREIAALRRQLTGQRGSS